jgi:hypothetical protein
MNAPQDYLNTLEGFPENQSLLDRDNLCKLLEGYWEWRESKEWVAVEDGLPETPPKYFDEDAGLWFTPLNVRVIVTDGDNVFEETCSKDGFRNKEITHWQKLPTLPK